MLTRSLVAWLVFSAALVTLAYATQADEFDTLFIGWSMLLSVPIALCSYLGGFSSPDGKTLQYPSLTMCVLSAWILGVGPSLIVEAPESYIAFNFTQLGLSWARALFIIWCIVFVIAAGRPDDRKIQVRVRAIEFWVLAACSTVILAYLIRLGMYSNYQGSGPRVYLESGSLASVCKTIGNPLTTLLPALSLFAYVRAASPQVKLAAALCFAAACIALLLSTSRGAVVMATLTCLFLSRKLGLRFRMSVMVGLVAALPIVFVLIMAYRQTLSGSSTSATSVSAYVSTAAQSTGTVASDDLARSDAIAALSINLRARLWYGQQFSATVDEWLDNGPALKGSLLAGLIRSAPVWLFPAKNAIAEEYELEQFLQATGRFPLADLGPMPWQQWLFELGIAGLIFGAVFYGMLARAIERRLRNTGSVYEAVFWLGIFLAISAPEQTTDAMILTGRIIAAFVMFAAGIAFVVRMFVRTPAARPGEAPGAVPRTIKV